MMSFSLLKEPRSLSEKMAALTGGADKATDGQDLRNGCGSQILTFCRRERSSLAEYDVSRWHDLSKLSFQQELAKWRHDSTSLNPDGSAIMGCRIRQLIEKSSCTTTFSYVRDDGKLCNLPVADTFIQGSACDPFVTFQLGDEYLRSSCVNGALNPVWQPAETFEFELPHTSQKMERQLVIQVVDNDSFKMDDLVGELRLSLSTFERRPNEAIVETYELVVPEALKQASKSPDKKTTIQLDICYAEETDGQKTLCVWENEDYVDGKWTPSHNKERRHWSSFDLQTSSDNFDHVVPEVPEGLEGAGWAYSTKKGDDHGWVYASTYTGPWSSMSSPVCYARRRLWQNNCRPAVACE